MTKLMQPLSQGNNVLHGLVIGTHSTLDIPMVLRSIHKKMLVTEKSYNWLSLNLGTSPISSSSKA